MLAVSTIETTWYPRELYRAAAQVFDLPPWEAVAAFLKEGDDQPLGEWTRSVYEEDRVYYPAVFMDACNPTVLIKTAASRREVEARLLPDGDLLVAIRFPGSGSEIAAGEILRALRERDYITDYITVTYWRERPQFPQSYCAELNELPLELPDPPAV